MKRIIISLILLLVYSQHAVSQCNTNPENVYIEPQIVKYMTDRPFGGYETFIKGMLNNGYTREHRNYLRFEPREGDVVIVLDRELVGRLRTLTESRPDMICFDAALRLAQELPGGN